MKIMMAMKKARKTCESHTVQHHTKVCKATLDSGSGKGIAWGVIDAHRTVSMQLQTDASSARPKCKCDKIFEANSNVDFAIKMHADSNIGLPSWIQKSPGTCNRMSKSSPAR